MTTIPVGGTTGMSHEHTAQIEEAVQWIASTPPEARPQAIVPALRQRFGLTPIEACVAIREAKLIHTRVQ